jgi:hypothetical protein
MLGKSLGGMWLNGSNMVDAWNDRPASLPSSYARLVAEGHYPGSYGAVAAADAVDIGLDVLALKVPAGGLFNRVGDFIWRNQTQVDDWAAATRNLPSYVSVAMPGMSTATLANLGATFVGAAATAYEWATGTPCLSCTAAGGGFVLYPGKANANQQRIVYRK